MSGDRTAKNIGLQLGVVLFVALLLLGVLVALILEASSLEKRKQSVLQTSVHLTELVAEQEAMFGSLKVDANVFGAQANALNRVQLGELGTAARTLVTLQKDLTRSEQALSDDVGTEDNQPAEKLRMALRKLARDNGLTISLLNAAIVGKGSETSKAKLRFLAPTLESARSSLAEVRHWVRLSIHSSMERLTARSQNTNRLIFTCIGALVLVIAVPLSLRLKKLLDQALSDRAELESAYDELLQTKSELQQRALEMDEALEEAKAQTQLFEYASNRFQQLFGGLPVGCLTYDRFGMVQECNKAMSELVGLDDYVVCFQPMSFVFRGDEYESPIDEIMQDVLDNGSNRSFEWTHRDLSGKPVYALYITYPLRNINGDVLGGIVAGFNMTERILAEQALAVSQERYQLAVSASSTGLFDWNIAGNAQYWSPRVHQILALPEDFVPGTDELEQRVHPDDRDRMVSSLKAHLQGSEGPFHCEFRARRGDGDYVYVLVRGNAVRDEDGSPVRMAGAIDDIHARKTAELALAESEARFRDVTEAAGEFVYELDENARFVLITERISEILGYSVQEFIGKRPGSFWKGGYRRLIEQGLSADLKTKGKVQNFLVCGIAKSGEDRWLKMSGCPVFGPRGEFKGYRGTGLDVTEQKMAEQALAEAHKLLHDTLESIRDCFYSLDSNLRFAFVNTAACQQMGVTAADIVGRNVSDLVSKSLGSGLMKQLNSALTLKTERAFELLDSLTGAWFHYRVYPREDGVSVFYQDVTDRKRFEAQIAAQMVEINEKNTILQLQQQNLEEANRRLSTLATTDGLTGLKNHKAFQSSLADLFEQAELMNEPISVIMIDVDHFKKYNDAFGHPAGDEVLRSVAAVLKSIGRKSDVVARYGGEEFVVILPGTTEAGAVKVAERIRKGIADHQWPYSEVTASLGVSNWSGGDVTRAQLVDQADAALYRSKKEGRNRVTVYHGDDLRRAA